MNVPRLRHDEGAALVMTIAFVTLFGVFVSAVLFYTSSALRAEATGREGREAMTGAYARARAAELAVQAAMDEYGRSGRCVDETTVNSIRMVIDCAAVPPDDPAPPGGTERATKPRWAIHTLGTHPDDGIDHPATPASRLPVEGGIFSASRIGNGAITATEMSVAGRVSAAGDCIGRIVSTFPPLRCANRAGAAQLDVASGRDPRYSPATLPPLVPADARAVPCPAEGGIVELPAGYYDDGMALSELTGTRCASLERWVLHLKGPAVYYFDSGTWAITHPGLTVVGGTLGANPAAVPGACRTDSPAAGVQLIFGGESRIDLQAGALEICAQPSLSTQQIALYGLRSTIPDDRSLRHIAVPSGASSPSDPGAAAFGEPVSALSINGETATATIAPAGLALAALELSGYQPIPPGSNIVSATLRVAHAETGPVASVRAVLASGGTKPAVSIVSDPSPSCDTTRSLCRHATLSEDQVDLKALGFIDAAHFAALTLRWEAQLAPSADTAGTASLDGAVVEIVYDPPVSLAATVTAGSADAGVVAFVNPGDATSIADSGLTASALLGDPSDPALRRTAALVLSGYGGLENVPAGARLRNVRLRAVHAEQPGVSAISATVTSATGSTLPIGFTPTGSCDPASSACELVSELSDALDLAALGVEGFAGLAGLSVTWQAELGDVAVSEAHLDGIVLEVTYALPAYEAQRGCVATPGPAGCPVLRAVTGATVRVHGTVYTPRAALDIRQADVAEPVFDRGVIARSVTLSLSPAAGYDGPVVVLPGHRRTVVFTALANARFQRLTPETAQGDFTPAERTGAIDGQAAAALLSTAAPSAVAVLEGYRSFTEIPPGSSIDAVVLRIAHREERLLGEPVDLPIKLNLTVTPGTGPPVVLASDADCDEGVDLCIRDEGIAEDRIPLDLAPHDDMSLADPAQLAVLSVRYEASLAEGATSGMAHLDGIAIQVTYTPPHVLKPGSATGAGFTDASNALAIDGTETARAVLDPSATPAARIDLSGYRKPDIPSGSRIRAVALRVAHAETSEVGEVRAVVSSLSSTAEITADRSTPCAPGLLCLRGDLVEDRIDLRSRGFDGPGALDGVEIKWHASLAGGTGEPGTASIDGIWIEVTYTAPILRAEAGFDGPAPEIMSWTVVRGG